MFEEGTILLVHNNKVHNLATFLGWCIRKATKGYWNHAAIVVYIKGEPMVYEAIGRGCMITGTLSEWLQGDRVFEVIKVPLPFDYEDRLIDTMGRRYDYSSTLYFHALRLLVKRWLGHTTTFATHKFYCSELVAYVFDIPNWWTFTPKDLAIYFNAHRK